MILKLYRLIAIYASLSSYLKGIDMYENVIIFNGL